MKSKEELTALKEEVETVSRKQHKLTEEELAQVSGGGNVPRAARVVEPSVDPKTTRAPRIE